MRACSAFAILVALSMMLVFASVPAIQAARQDPQDGLRADGRSVTAGSGAGASARR